MPAGTIPLAALVTDTVKPTPLQVTVVIAFTTAIGFTVTVKVNTPPVHAPDTGVTKYVPVLVIFVVFVKVPFKLGDTAAWLNPPVIPVPVGVPHVYVVPEGITPCVLLVGVMINETPLQDVNVIAFTIAFGLMVTRTVKVDPVQIPLSGVTVYVAVWEILVGLTKLPVIDEAPVPDTPPVSPPVTPGVNQLYVVPDGTIPLVALTGNTLKDTPLQVMAVMVVINAFGFSVTVTVNGLPVQLPVNGITV